MGLWDIFQSSDIDKLAQKGNVKRLCQLLDSDDKNTRDKAREALIGLGKTSLPAVLSELEKPNREFGVLESLHDTIGQIVAGILREDTEGLIGLSGHDNPFLRRRLIEALAHHEDPRVLGILYAAARDENPALRNTAIRILGECGDENSIIPLIRAHFWIDSITVSHARTALSKLLRRLGDPARAMEYAFSLKDAKESRIQAFILDYFSKADAGASSGALLLMLDENDKKNRSKIVRDLGKKKVREAVPALLKILEARQAKASKDTLESLFLGEVIHALTDIGDPRAVEPLQAILGKKTSSLKRYAFYALKSLNSFKTPELLMKLLKEKDELLENEAIALLGNFKTPDVAEALSGYLKSQLRVSHWKVSAQPFKAADTLISLGRPEGANGVETLIDWLFQHEWDEEKLFEYASCFGDYKDLLLKSSKYLPKQEIKGGDSKTYQLRYENHSLEAVKALCALDTPVSSNILHKVFEKTNVKVEVSHTEFDAEYRELQFDQEKNLALKALQERGDPSYNPEFYIGKSAWKLPPGH
jgi:HEAT repeat protein